MATMIPEEKINEIRESTNIVDVVSQYVQLKKSGRNHFGFCPFHQERTPSFSVAEEKQIFHCFSCGRGGNVFKFIMEIDGLSFPESVVKVAEMSHVELDPTLIQNTGNTSENQDSNFDKLVKIHEDTADLFHHILLNTKAGEQALVYLEKRGMSRELIETFKIGFAPKERTILSQFLTGKDYEKDLLADTGLFVERDSGDLIDRFYDRLMFPIRNQQGKVIAFSGRIIEPEKYPEAPKYLNSPETKIFNKRKVLFNFDLARPVIRREKEVILFEGFMDVIAAYQVGIQNGVASMGTSLTNEQVHMLDRVTGQVLIAYDGDNAGIEATKRAVDLLTNETSFDVSVASLSEGLDPDEFIKKFGADAFKELLAHGRDTVFSFKMRYFRKGKNLQNESERIAYIETIMNEMSNLHSAVERDVYMKQLSQEFGIGIEALKEQLQSNLQQQKQQRKTTERHSSYQPADESQQYSQFDQQITTIVPKRKLNQVERAERHLLKQMFTHEEAWVLLRSEFASFAFIHEEYQMLYMLYEAFLSKSVSFGTGGFQDFIQENHLKNIQAEIEMIELNEEMTEQEIRDYVYTIESKHHLQEELEVKRRELLEASRTGNRELSNEISRTIIDLSRRIKQKR